MSVTQAYRLADELKEVTPGLLLLTATPMQLHQYELFSLVELVEPGLFRDYKDYDRQRSQLPRLNEVMRQLKQWGVLTELEREEVLAEHQALLAPTTGTELTPEDLATPEDVSDLMDRLIDRHPLAEVMVRNRKAEIGGFAGARRTASWSTSATTRCSSTRTSPSTYGTTTTWPDRPSRTPSGSSWSPTRRCWPAARSRSCRASAGESRNSRRRRS